MNVFDNEIGEIRNYLNELERINREGTNNLEFVNKGILMTDKINKLIMDVYKSQNFEYKNVRDIATQGNIDMSRYKIGMRGTCIEDNTDEFGFNHPKKYCFKIIDNNGSNRLLIEYIYYGGDESSKECPIKLKPICHYERCFITDGYSINGTQLRHCIDYDAIKRKWIIVVPNKNNIRLNSCYENYTFSFE